MVEIELLVVLSLVADALVVASIIYLAKRQGNTRMGASPATDGGLRIGPLDAA